MKKGYIKLDRKLIESDMWLIEPFTKGQAWVDMIFLANFADVEHMYRGKIQTIYRGELAVSEDWLMTRWKWSKGKVRRFLENLEEREMISVSRSTSGSIICIKNYNKYQDGPVKTQKTTKNGNANGNTNGNAQPIEISTFDASGGNTDGNTSSKTGGNTGGKHKKESNKFNKENVVILSDSVCVPMPEELRKKYKKVVKTV